MLLDLALSLFFLFLLTKSAQYAIDYSSRLAKALRLSEFIISFFVVALISASPEASVSIISALKGKPDFGIGALLGSNVVDLTIVFSMAALFAKGSISVKSAILKKDLLYLLLLAFPLLLGLDGNFSRVDGIVLVLSGIFFFITLSIESRMFRKRLDYSKSYSAAVNLLLLALSFAAIIVSAYFTVKYGVSFANDVGIPPMLVSLTVISIGTCLPELMFSIKAVRSSHSELALGDILGTVIADATIFLGLVVLISPFSFNPNLIFVTGGAMFLAGLAVLFCLDEKKSLTKSDAIFMIIFYLTYLVIEFAVNA
jgi:cation:H+ antiporter